jgi:hypothetical protein
MAAAAAVSVESVVEIWASGRSWRQHLHAALMPIELQDLGPTDRVGTRGRFELDPTYFTAGATIPRDLAKLCPLPDTTSIQLQDLTISADGQHLTTANGRLRITDLRPTT